MTVLRSVSVLAAAAWALLGSAENLQTPSDAGLTAALATDEVCDGTSESDCSLELRQLRGEAEKVDEEQISVNEESEEENDDDDGEDEWDNHFGGGGRRDNRIMNEVKRHLTVAQNMLEGRDRFGCRREIEGALRNLERTNDCREKVHRARDHLRHSLKDLDRGEWRKVERKLGDAKKNLRHCEMWG